MKRQAAGDAREVVKKAKHSKECMGGQSGGGRFGLEVRALGAEVSGAHPHVIFVTRGVLDLIVDYARPVVPMFARAPTEFVTGEMMRPLADRFHTRHLELDHDLKKLLSKPLVPPGTVLSCPLIGGRNDEARVDCIVVVGCPVEQHLDWNNNTDLSDTRGCWWSGIAGRRHTHTRWTVGVIVPVVYTDPAEPQEVRFGADRTIFEEDLAQATEWRPHVPPENGLYAVHYVNAHPYQVSFYDPMKGRHRFVKTGPTRGVFLPETRNPLFQTLEDTPEEEHRIHMLPTEVDAADIEDELLRGHATTANP
jgi:hypothetical protein